MDKEYVIREPTIAESKDILFSVGHHLQSLTMAEEDRNRDIAIHQGNSLRICLYQLIFTTWQTNEGSVRGNCGHFVNYKQSSFCLLHLLPMPALFHIYQHSIKVKNFATAFPPALIRGIGMEKQDLHLWCTVKIRQILIIADPHGAYAEVWIY